MKISKMEPSRKYRINTRVLNNLLFPVRPIDLQSEFAGIYHKAKLLRKSTITQFEELDNNYKALMQRAFNS